MWSGTASDTHDTTSTSTSHNDMFKASSDGMGNKEYSIDLLTKKGGKSTYSSRMVDTNKDAVQSAIVSQRASPFVPRMRDIECFFRALTKVVLR